jgi:hypothetical protein
MLRAGMSLNTAVRNAIAGAVLGMLLWAMPALGAEPGSGTLRGRDHDVRWQGRTFVNQAQGVSTPALCGAVSECDEFELEVNLGKRELGSRGLVQVGIRWHPEDFDLDLFVYGPDGELAAKSDGVFASTGEQVNLPGAVNGAYRVVVVPRMTSDLGTTYEGIAQIDRAPARRPARRLLPDLRAIAPRDIHFAIGGYLFNPATAVPSSFAEIVAGIQETTSCYPEEVIERGASRCMRFSQIIANVGEGPFELRYRMEGLLTDQQLRQRIYRSDGSFADRVADTYEFHAAHAHFHYKNFARSKIWKADARGRRIGTEPVRVGKKNGFCMIDVEPIWFGRIGDGPRSYYFPRCNAPTEHDASGTYMTNGISPGWADVYNWFLGDQYIDVEGVPDGCYVLQTIADTENTIVESNEHNNSISRRFVLEGDSGRFLSRREIRAGACR